MSSKSPSFNQIKNNMITLEDKLSSSKSKNIKGNIYIILLLLFYPIICIFYLLYFKPSIILKKDKKDISLVQLILVYIFMLFPLIFYFILKI